MVRKIRTPNDLLVHQQGDDEGYKQRQRDRAEAVEHGDTQRLPDKRIVGKHVDVIVQADPAWGW